MSTLTTHSVDGPVTLSSLEVTDANGDTILYSFGDYDGTLASIGAGAALYGVTPEQAFFDPDAPTTSDVLPLTINGVDISPVDSIGVGRFDIFTKSTDNNFIHHILNQDDKSVVDARTFSNATYVITDFYNDVMLKLTLGDGITTIESGFLIEIPADRIKFTGIFNHKFTVDDLPYTFYRDLKVV